MPNGTGDTEICQIWVTASSAPRHSDKSVTSEAAQPGGACPVNMGPCFPLGHKHALASFWDKPPRVSFCSHFAHLIGTQMGSTAGEAAWPAEPCPGSRGVAGVGEQVSWLG